MKSDAPPDPEYIWIHSGFLGRLVLILSRQPRQDREDIFFVGRDVAPTGCLPRLPTNTLSTQY